MAIRTFKEIINNNGYRISSKDREIFEEGSLRSFFGFSKNDYIEFIVYDVNDNQLPLKITEAGDTALVKYIQLDSETIRDYFMIAEGTVLQQGELPAEYFIDVERLLKEAGYNEGIFKTQITLINQRLGISNTDVNSRMWIKEISPSRTEARLLPQINSASIETDLLQRFEIFKNDGEFRDDNIYYFLPFASSISSSDVEVFIRNAYSDKFLEKLQTEFSIDIQVFSTRVYNKFMEAIRYEVNNKISDINDINYGKDKETLPSIELSVEQIKDKCIEILTTIVSNLLPQRVTEPTNYDIELEESIDEIQEIIQRRTSDVIYQPNIPNLVVSSETIKTLEEIEFDSVVDDEYSSANVPSNTPVVRPNYNKTRTVTNIDEETDRNIFIVDEPTNGITLQ